MSDENSPFNFEPPNTNGIIQLGYLVQNQHTHPFVLTFHDLTNLFVMGPRAKDIYFNLFIQLCDDHQIPILVMKGYPSENLEEQVCEGQLWELDLDKDAITFNALGFSVRQHLSRQISILINLFEQFAPLSQVARNLLHVIIWRVILSVSKPTIQYLQDTLLFYQHHKTAYFEIQRLFDAIPLDILDVNYDNIALSRIQNLPTIISGNNSSTLTFAMNLLLMKLLAEEDENLPPLFLINPPRLSIHLLQWLHARYSSAQKPFVIFETQDKELSFQISQSSNFILSSGLDSELSSYLQLSEKERNILKHNSDQVAVTLRSEPATRFITIF